MNYQRNGIGGDPFFVLVFDWYDVDGQSGKNFIATFSHTKNSIDASCRVNYKIGGGDVFADNIEQELNRLIKEYGKKGASYYDLIALINKRVIEEKKMKA